MNKAPVKGYLVDDDTFFRQGTNNIAQTVSWLLWHLHSQGGMFRWESYSAAISHLEAKPDFILEEGDE